MANEVQIAIAYALTQYKITKSFIDDNVEYKYYNFDYIKLGLYFADNDKDAGRVNMNVIPSTYITNISVCYRNTTYANGQYDMIVQKSSTFAKEYQGRPIYIASVKDKTKWRLDIVQKPDWNYDIEEWNTYFKDVFDSNWDNVGKYLYEVKHKLPFKLGSNTLRMDDSAIRWVILKDGMLMNLNNIRDISEFDDTVTLKGIPIMFILLNMLPRLTKFESKVDIIQKLRDRIGNKYTKSVIVMKDNGDLRKHTFTSSRVYWGATELTIEQIQQLVDNPNAWNGDSLKRLPA